MPRIPPVSLNDPKAAAGLAKVTAVWGESWNITNGMAQNPAVLEGFMGLWDGQARSGLSPLDREVICMQMAVLNGCHYCVPAHRFTTAQQGLDKVLIERIATGETLDGASRPAVLQKLVLAIVKEKGELSDVEFENFIDAGLSLSEMVAVVGEIAHCVFTNYFNRLAKTELDPFLMPHRGG